VTGVVEIGNGPPFARAVMVRFMDICVCCMANWVRNIGELSTPPPDPEVMMATMLRKTNINTPPMIMRGNEFCEFTVLRCMSCSFLTLMFDLTRKRASVRSI
jgi:hypothetical protein